MVHPSWSQQPCSGTFLTWTKWGNKPMEDSWLYLNMLNAYLQEVAEWMGHSLPKCFQISICHSDGIQVLDCQRQKTLPLRQNFGQSVDGKKSLPNLAQISTNGIQKTGIESSSISRWETNGYFCQFLHCKTNRGVSRTTKVRLWRNRRILVKLAIYYTIGNDIIWIRRQSHRNGVKIDFGCFHKSDRCYPQWLTQMCDVCSSYQMVSKEISRT